MSAGPGTGQLRVMIVTDQYEPMVGGVPTATRELARGLASRGHQVAVVAPAASWRGEQGHAGVTDVALAGQPAVIRRGSLRWPWYEGARLGFLPAPAARGLFAALAPDVTHIHSPLTLGMAALRAARRHRVPVVYTNHYLPANVHPAESRAPAASAALDALFYGYLTWFANRCDLVTAPTQTALGLLRTHGLRAPSRAVSNGIDLTTYRPGPADSALAARYGIPADGTGAQGGGDGPPVILSVGRLSPEKRADLLIEALPLIAGNTALLVLAGTGPDEARLRHRAADLGVTARVRFTGYVPEADLPGLYRLASVFAIASEAELQSLATMEAMAAGLPVVAVRAGALPELVRDGANGLLARPGDAASLAAALGQLCGDRERRAAMSAASLKIIAAHDRHCQLAQWEFLYRTLAPPGTEQTKVSDGRP